MLKFTNVVRTSVIVGLLAASGAMGGTALARQDAPSAPQNKSTAVQDQANQSVLVVSSYKNGTVTEQQSTNSAQIETAGQDKNNNVDQAAKIQAQPTSHEPTFAFYGK